ncbi:MAG: hypothetical protein DHS80DRAFT_24421 [Piptocephalis tieghemiana]|nr:MAG: hypothetical protein DHS80DRAFT_24421 [Piptocephalis tieghemiana]
MDIFRDRPVREGQARGLREALSKLSLPPVPADSGSSTPVASMPLKSIVPNFLIPSLQRIRHTDTLAQLREATVDACRIPRPTTGSSSSSTSTTTSSPAINTSSTTATSAATAAISSTSTPPSASNQHPPPLSHHPSTANPASSSSFSTNTPTSTSGSGGGPTTMGILPIQGAAQYGGDDDLQDILLAGYVHLCVQEEHAGTGGIEEAIGSSDLMARHRKPPPSYPDDPLSGSFCLPVIRELEAILITYGALETRAFFHLLYKYIKYAPFRLYILRLCTRYSVRKGLHLHEAQRTGLPHALMYSLQWDHSVDIVTSSLHLLTILMPHTAVDLIPHLPTLFRILVRLLCWSSLPASSSPIPGLHSDLGPDSPSISSPLSPPSQDLGGSEGRGIKVLTQTSTNLAPPPSSSSPPSSPTLRSSAQSSPVPPPAPLHFASSPTNLTLSTTTSSSSVTPSKSPYPSTAPSTPFLTDAHPNSQGLMGSPSIHGKGQVTSGFLSPSTTTTTTPTTSSTSSPSSSSPSTTVASSASGGMVIAKEPAGPSTSTSKGTGVFTWGAGAPLFTMSDFELTMADDSANRDSRTRPDPSLFFTFLYGMFPCNLTSFLRAPSQYLGPPRLERDDDAIRDAARPFLLNHTITEDLILIQDPEAEKADTGRLTKYEPAELISACLRLQMPQAGEDTGTEMEAAIAQDEEDYEDEDEGEQGEEDGMTLKGLRRHERGTTTTSTPITTSSSKITKRQGIGQARAIEETKDGHVEFSEMPQPLIIPSSPSSGSSSLDVQSLLEENQGKRRGDGGGVMHQEGSDDLSFPRQTRVLDVNRVLGEEGEEGEEGEDMPLASPSSPDLPSPYLSASFPSIGGRPRALSSPLVLSTKAGSKGRDEEVVTKTTEGEGERRTAGAGPIHLSKYLPPLTEEEEQRAGREDRVIRGKLHFRHALYSSKSLQSLSQPNLLPPPSLSPLPSGGPSDLKTPKGGGLEKMDFVDPGEGQGWEGGGRVVEARVNALRREVILLRNEVDMEYFLRQQQVRYIGRMFSEGLKLKAGHIVRESLYHQCRHLTKELALAKSLHVQQRSELSRIKERHLKWERELNEKLRALREERRSSKLSREALREERDTLKARVMELETSRERVLADRLTLEQQEQALDSHPSSFSPPHSSSFSPPSLTSPSSPPQPMDMEVPIQDSSSIKHTTSGRDGGTRERIRQWEASRSRESAWEREREGLLGMVEQLTQELRAAERSLHQAKAQERDQCRRADMAELQVSHLTSKLHREREATKNQVRGMEECRMTWAKETKESERRFDAARSSIVQLEARIMELNAQSERRNRVASGSGSSYGRGGGSSSSGAGSSGGTMGSMPISPGGSRPISSSRDKGPGGSGGGGEGDSSGGSGGPSAMAATPRLSRSTVAVAGAFSSKGSGAVLETHRGESPRSPTFSERSITSSGTDRRVSGSGKRKDGDHRTKMPKIKSSSAKMALEGIITKDVSRQWHG